MNQSPRSSAPPHRPEATDPTAEMPRQRRLGLMRCWAASVLLVLLTACSDGTDPTPRFAAYDAETIALNNRGVGLMGRFDYDAAKAVFDQLVQRHPASFEFRLNQTIALKNRQGEGDEVAALAGFQALLDEAPDDLRARYCTGLLQYRAGSMDDAVTNLRFVHQADANDPHAAYFYGQALQKAGDEQAARAAYEAALVADPYLRSAYYALALIERREGDMAAAQAALDDYQRLGANPRAMLAEFKYTRMGRHCEVVAVGTAALPTAAPQGPLFEAPESLGLRLQLDAALPLSMLSVDVDGDGLLDLYVTGAGSERAATLLLRGLPDGGFEPLPAHPLSGIDAVLAAAFGDHDNDGLVDAYLGRRGPNQLWRQTQAGQWQEIGEASNTVAGDQPTRDVMWLDADHDGDLDLWLRQQQGPMELLNNNLDGSFRPLAAEQGLADPAGAGSLPLLPVDLDNDRDFDLILPQPQGGSLVYRNDRGWQYEASTELQQLGAQPLLALLASEHAASGQAALYALDPGLQLTRWQRTPEQGWQPHALGQLAQAPIELKWLDLDGDGAAELLLVDAAGVSVYAAGEALGTPLYRFDHDAAPWRAVALDSRDDGRGPRLLLLDADGELWQMAPGSGRWPFLRLMLSGATDQGEGMRSNHSGIGTRLLLRSGERWSGLTALRSGLGVGHGLQPLTLGLAGAPAADFVRLLWTDGVSQSELDLAVGQTHHITETQRQLSSCPVLFAWDGSSHRFVSDVLGVAGIGFLVAPGEYAEPRPWERFLLPAGLAQLRDGAYEFRLGEPMEEIAYIDRIELAAYDLPAGWQLAIDERMATDGRQPTGAALAWRQEAVPRSASMNGRDVLADLQTVDLRAAPPGPTDARFLGRLQQPFELLLEFDTALDRGPGQPVLLADGWVEYPYSQTVFAAWQAQASYDPPSLWARDGDGRWHLLAERFGYPAGMPRQMAYPLPPLPPGSDALKLVGNLEIYFDRVSVVWAEALPLQPLSLPLLHVAVADAGYAARSTGPQKQPHYDYQRRAPLWDARHLVGDYTEFGEATPLLARTDGALAIFGPGEELQMRFDAGPAVPPGHQRRLVLRFDGWAKDMDLYTGSGGTVEPLPGVERRDAEAEALHQRYNTRRAGGY